MNSTLYYTGVLLGVLLGSLAGSILGGDGKISEEDYKLFLKYKEQTSSERAKKTKCDKFNHHSNQPSLCKYKLKNNTEKIDRCVDIGGYYEG